MTIKLKPRLAVARVYEDVNGYWRWSLTAPNGRNIANGSEAYTSRGDATKAWKRARSYAKGHLTVIVGEPSFDHMDPANFFHPSVKL